MTTLVAQWGHSLAIRLPKEITRKAGLHRGDRVSITAGEDGSVIIHPARPCYDLNALVDGITPQNLPSEVAWGQPRGKEVW